VRCRSSFCFAVTFLLAALPSIALADVMEIGRDGHSWVAGGPRVQVSVPAAAELGPETGQAPLTEVSPAAGPREWQARVAELAAKYDISATLLEAVVW
jgi:hypothetical protein